MSKINKINVVDFELMASFKETETEKYEDFLESPLHLNQPRAIRMPIISKDTKVYSKNFYLFCIEDKMIFQAIMQEALKNKESLSKLHPIPMI